MAKVSRKFFWHEYDKKLNFDILTWGTKNVHYANSAQIPYARFYSQLRSAKLWTFINDVIINAVVQGSMLTIEPYEFQLLQQS